MSLSQSERFERSIVRFFKPNGREEAGAGFLIDRDCVITCAHVVNAALDLAEKTAEKPTGAIDLEFCWAKARRSARVVGWHRVLASEAIKVDNLEDIAILKLVDPLPAGVEPVGDLLAIAYAANSSFKAFGFAEDLGRWATGQLLNQSPTTGWIQLEDDKAQGKRVKGGFSGTPVWDEVQQAIVGIVVAADPANSDAASDKVAHAIPASKLRSALRQLDGQTLAEILGSNSPKPLPFSETYHLIKPPGYRNPCPKLLANILGEIQEMSQLDAPGDRLLLFAASLSLNVNQVPREIRDRLMEWLVVRSSDVAKLEAYVRQLEPANDSDNVQEHHILVVLEESKQQEPGKYRINAWVMPNRDVSKQEKLQFLPESEGNEQIITLAQFPQWLGNLKAKMADYAWPNRTIEIFLPLELLNHEVDRKIPEEDDFDDLFAVSLGCEYRVIVRFTERLQGSYKYRGEWQQKWQNLTQKLNVCASQTLLSGDCASDGELKQVFRQLMPPDAIGIKRTRPPETPIQRSILAGLLRTGVPVAVWLRCDRPGQNCQVELDRVLTGPLGSLSDRVHQIRRDHDTEDETAIGQHLSLMWDDPTCLPPGYGDPLAWAK